MYKILKRLLDLIVTVVLLILLSPLLIPIVLGLKFTAEGEVFYGQNRIGYRNRTFKIWKFATMLKNSPNMGTGSLTLRNDPRVTTIGKYLRITKLNELPQLINVLVGDMSLVGPRPQMKVDFEAYSEDVQARIYNVVPGITGIGSIVFRDEEKLISASTMEPKAFYKAVIAPYKGALEIWYQEHASISTDIKIIFLTAWAIVVPDSELHYKIFKDLPVKPSTIVSEV